MTDLLKRVLPFVLALGLGITLGRLTTHPGRLRPDTALIESHNSQVREPHDSLTASLSINYVPELDFTDAARRTGGFSGSLRLRALLGADGKVSKVEPEVMLPYGVTDISSVETGRMGPPTPAIMDGRFVETLPDGLTQAAIEAAQRIRFTPAMKDGQPISVSVTITDEFSLINSHVCVGMGCSDITTTVRDGDVVKWRKTAERADTYFKNAQGYRSIGK